MKDIFKIILFILFSVWILFLLTDCSSYQLHTTNKQVQQLYVKTVPIRALSEEQLNTSCKTLSVTFNMLQGKFILSLPDTTISLKGLYKYSADREYYEGYDQYMHKYSLYYYAYNNRVYIQITPLHNGQVPFIDKSEVIYIITSDSICS